MLISEKIDVMFLCFYKHSVEIWVKFAGGEFQVRLHVTVGHANI